MQHEDGKPWGFRALYPGADVIDHQPLPQLPSEASEPTTRTEEDNDSITPMNGTTTDTEHTAVLIQEHIEDDDDEDTAKRQAIQLPTLPPDFALAIPETPIPAFIQDEYEEHEEEGNHTPGRGQAIAPTMDEAGHADGDEVYEEEGNHTPGRGQAIAPTMDEAGHAIDADTPDPTDPPWHGRGDGLSSPSSPD